MLGCNQVWGFEQVQLALTCPDGECDQPVEARGEPSRDTWWEKTLSNVIKALLSGSLSPQSEWSVGLGGEGPGCRKSWSPRSPGASVASCCPFHITRGVHSPVVQGSLTICNFPTWKRFEAGTKPFKSIVSF